MPKLFRAWNTGTKIVNHSGNPAQNLIFRNKKNSAQNFILRQESKSSFQVLNKCSVLQKIPIPTMIIISPNIQTLKFFTLGLYKEISKFENCPFSFYSAPSSAIA